MLLHGAHNTLCRNIKELEASDFVQLASSIQCMSRLVN